MCCHMRSNIYPCPPCSNESSSSNTHSPGKVLALERLIREKNCELNLAGTVGQQLLDKYAKKQEEYWWVVLLTGIGQNFFWQLF